MDRILLKDREGRVPSIPGIIRGLREGLVSLRVAKAGVAIILAAERLPVSASTLEVEELALDIIDCMESDPELDALFRG